MIAELTDNINLKFKRSEEELIDLIVLKLTTLQDYIKEIDNLDKNNKQLLINNIFRLKDYYKTLEQTILDTPIPAMHSKIIKSQSNIKF